MGAADDVGAQLALRRTRYAAHVAPAACQAISAFMAKVWTACKPLCWGWSLLALPGSSIVKLSSLSSMANPHSRKLQWPGLQPALTHKASCVSASQRPPAALPLMMLLSPWQPVQPVLCHFWDSPGPQAGAKV